MVRSKVAGRCSWAPVKKDSKEALIFLILTFSIQRATKENFRDHKIEPA